MVPLQFMTAFVRMVTGQESVPEFQVKEVFTSKLLPPLKLPPLKMSDETVTLFVRTGPLELIVAESCAPGTPAGFQFAGLNQSLDELPVQTKLVPADPEKQQRQSKAKTGKEKE